MIDGAESGKIFKTLEYVVCWVSTTLVIPCCSAGGGEYGIKMVELVYFFLSHRKLKHH